MRTNLNWLSDPTIFRINRLDAHSDHCAYAAPWEIAAGKSSLRQSLDGQWRFHWSSCPGECPADFWQEDYDCSHFGTIQVPGHMETQGYGQIQYINALYPWDGHCPLTQPQVDLDNDPVGSYVREFDLEEGLWDKRVCISFQGVEQACVVWLNGHFIGYSEDSFTPSDFDLTPYIKKQGNRLCVEVYKRSSAAWLEDQDFFRFSGIFRPVFLYAKPAVHVDDVWFKTELNEDNRSGSLTIRLLLSGETDHAALSCSMEGLFEGALELHEENGYLFSQKLEFSDIHPWDHGDPHLYDISLSLYHDGELCEVVPYRIGFRRMEMKNKLMLLNGRRLLLNGVNRHEWNPHSGRCITMDDMNAAVEMFRNNNINAVRTSHYPNRSEWYSLCDEKGIYVMDETNLESHGSWCIDPARNVPASHEEWRGCTLDRAQSMFERDKNHASVLFWSCGNESFAGQVLVDMANYFRSVDPSRLVHYENVHSTRVMASGAYWKPEYETISDMESRMYAIPAHIEEYLNNDPPKPFILCEYMHDMGNSIGGMESYATLGDRYPMYQGGFIWDYMDQALWYRNANGETVLGYGGDFGERQTDYNFSGNGIVTADGKPKPCMQDVRYWYSTLEERQAHDRANAEAIASAEPMERKPSSPLTITHGDGALGVKGEDFEILFGYSLGGPVSLISDGQEWIYRAPKPTFWRAPTENDLACGFPQKSAIWSAVDAYLHCSGWTILTESEQEVTIRYSYSAAVMPELNCEVTYTVRSDRTLEVSAHYFGGENRPQLPVFGLRFPTPAPVEQVQWLGLSGETYPDRKKGGIFGLHSEVPHIAPYLVPQECGCHMDSHRLTLCLNGKELLLEKTDEAFGFAALPYSHRQLEDALHAEELPVPTRTVISLYGAMRGVGGINTWGQDVEEAYHIHSDKDISLHFRIHL